MFDNKHLSSGEFQQMVNAALENATDRIKKDMKIIENKMDVLQDEIICLADYFNVYIQKQPEKFVVVKKEPRP